MDTARERERERDRERRGEKNKEKHERNAICIDILYIHSYSLYAIDMATFLIPPSGEDRNSAQLDNILQ